MSKKEFLFNPKNPKKSFDVYIDKNTSDTIPIKYATLNDVKNTIKNLENLYKKGKYTHKRISQVAIILNVRQRVISNRNPKIDKGRLALTKKYVDFLKKRTLEKNESKRKKLSFNI
jgi:hypothetical protein